MSDPQIPINQEDEELGEPLQSSQSAPVTPHAEVKADTSTTNAEVKPPKFKQRVNITEPWFKPATDDSKKERGVAVPSSFAEQFKAVLQGMSNVNVIDNKTRLWASSIREADNLIPFGNEFVSTLEDPKATFEQSVEFGGKSHRISKPKLPAVAGQQLTGERAVLRVLDHMSLGGIFSVPLWHTGIWLTFKAPGDASIVELNHIITSDKIQFGRNTYGLAFANTVCYQVGRVVDWALGHLYNTTLKIPEGRDPIAYLKSIIKAQDIPALIQGITCTMYPNGFPYRRACTADPETCNHVEEGIIDLTKLQLTNTSRLTERQRAHMSVRQQSSKDEASLTIYQDDFASLHDRQVIFAEGKDNQIAFTLRSPSISDYLSTGYRWVDSITDLADRVLAMDLKKEQLRNEELSLDVPLEMDQNARNKLITQHGQATALRQYQHWIRQIDVADFSMVDDDTIEQVCSRLSQDSDLVSFFLDEVKSYINHSTISLVGIPVYQCPACHKPQEPDVTYPHVNDVIPLDMINLFFGLLYLRLGKIKLR